MRYSAVKNHFALRRLSIKVDRPENWLSDNGDVSNDSPVVSFVSINVGALEDALASDIPSCDPSSGADSLSGKGSESMR